MKIQLRAWDESQNYMAYQGAPDLETLQSFIHHFGDKELMLCSLIKDRNGKDIYADDIVRCGYGAGIVKYDSGVFMIRWIDFGVDAVYELLSCRKWPYLRKGEDMFEVIGNVHENKSLLD
jgi:uncharacterized phage protein (TIGR01671 family)